MRKYYAEFIGTYILLFAGTGAIIINQQYNGAITHMGIAITFGLVVMSLIYAFGDISGAHFNPAVSIGFIVAGRFPIKQLFPYVISQLTGAVLASITLKALFPENHFLGSTIPSGTELQSFIMELILSFILMIVIINVATGSKEQGMFAGIAIGSVVGLDALFGGPVCGASMNPVRSIAPAIVSGHTEHLWLYIVAPILGAVLAVICWKLLVIKVK